MKKLLAVAAVLLASGCNFKSHSIPDAPLPFASVDYKVLGATTAEACGTYIFGIDWGHLFTDQHGQTSSSGAADPLSSLLGMLPIGGGTPEAARALYDALEKMPEATNLYAPKIHTTVTGFAPFEMPIFGKRCSSIEANGVKIGTGPVPNAE